MAATASARGSRSVQPPTPAVAAAVASAREAEDRQSEGVKVLRQLEKNIKELAMVAYPVKEVRDEFLKRPLLDKMMDLMQMGAIDLASFITLTSAPEMDEERAKAVARGKAELRKPHDAVWPKAAARIRAETDREPQFQEISAAYDEEKQALVFGDDGEAHVDCSEAAAAAPAAEDDGAAAPGGAAAASAAGAT